MMLESSPPDRKLDTGTSATRCALTDSSITDFRSAGGLARAGRSHVPDLPVLPDLELAAGPDPGPGACRELVHALDGAALLGDPVIEHGGDERARLDPQFRAERRDDRLELGGEDDAVAALGVEEGLDAERVAGEHQLAGRRVGDREREHAAELVEGGRPPVPPALEHYLGVRGSNEGRAGGLQLGPQLLVVVKLAVVDQRQAALAHRLVGRGGEVDDRQPPVTRGASRPARPRGSTPRPRQDRGARSGRS